MEQKQTMRGYLREAMLKYDMSNYETYDQVMKDCMAEFNRPRIVVQDAYNHLKGEPGYHAQFSNNRKYDTAAPAPIRAAPAAMTLTTDQLRMKYDVRAILRKRLDEVPKGTFYKEADLIDYAGLRGQPFRQHLERSEFDKYRGRAGGVVYYGHPESVQELKNEMVLT